MILLAHDIWTIATAAIISTTCAILGTFLVVRRNSLLGDAISHSILPGIALAFIISGSRNITPMLLGAFGAGLASVLATQLLTLFGKVRDDVAMGVVFSTFFAIGVIAITIGARNVDLDPGCVLYGLLELVPFDTIEIFGREIPRAFLAAAILCFITIAFVTLLFKEFRVVSFDPSYAASIGISPQAVHYLFMALVAASCVIAFEAVGSILVIALLIAPPAAALISCKRLSSTVVLAVLFGVLSSIFGYQISVKINSSAAGAIASMSGVIFGLAMLTNPRTGILFQIFRRIRLTIRIASEDILGELYRASESNITLKLTCDTIVRRAALLMLRASAQIEYRGDQIALTDKGEASARELVRSHRLWETYLATNLSLPEDHLHEPSHRVEHFISELTRKSLSNELQAERDPHGKKIPNGE